MVTAHWQRLRDELARRQDEGSTIRLWLRDDDAVAPTEALERLLGLTGAFMIPVAIASIPARSGEALANRLAGAAHASPLVHGWTHENHAFPGQKKQELGGNRTLAKALEDLSAAQRRMAQLFGHRFVPVLVPPWNRISPEIVPHLPGLGFTALSCFGSVRLKAPLPVINTHVDLIDWRGTRGCRDHAALVGDLLGQLDRIERSGEPVGILTHHLVHDEAAWTFLEYLFSLTGSFTCCRWQSANALIVGAQRFDGALPFK
jgi:hypothetical protein